MADLYVDTNGILQPLGVAVLRDSREDLLPPTRDKVETIAGMDGEFDFGSELNSRTIELHVCTDIMTPSERETMKRTIAGCLNPKTGAKTFAFNDSPDKIYHVFCDGRIQVQSIGRWITFVIPLRIDGSFIVSADLHTQVGSGVLANSGNIETPLTIEITGPVTNPSVTVGSDTLSWTGTVGVSDKLEIDTEYMTVKFNGSNAIADYTGGFPKLQPGETVVVAAAAGTTTWKWRDRWI